MKRQRGRGRKPGGGHNNFNPHQPNRALESSGPDVKVRGPAAHIYERYLQLARDAAASGDRVLSENYMQHADHYFRLVRMMQPAAPPPQAERFSAETDYEGGEDEGAVDAEGVEAENVADTEERNDVEVAVGPQQQQQYDRGEGDFRRRRGRRNRFRPGGEGEFAEGREDGQPREAREDRGPRPERMERPERPEQRDRAESGAERRERRERQPRERTEAEVQEGFSNGPRPAFLGGD